MKQKLFVTLLKQYTHHKLKHIIDTLQRISSQQIQKQTQFKIERN